MEPYSCKAGKKLGVINNSWKYDSCVILTEYPDNNRDLLEEGNSEKYKCMENPSRKCIWENSSISIATLGKRNWLKVWKVNNIIKSN